MPTTTGETASGRSTRASSSQAPGKRCRDRISATPTPNTVSSGTAMSTTRKVSHRACRASGEVTASQAGARPCWKARKKMKPTGTTTKRAR